jgi:hypothetical protein
MWSRPIQKTDRIRGIGATIDPTAPYGLPYERVEALSRRPSDSEGEVGMESESERRSNRSS